jgi:hypothetical protein
LIDYKINNTLITTKKLSAYFLTIKTKGMKNGKW